MNLYRLPVTRPVATSMFFLGVVLLGCIGWLRIPIELFPALTGDRLFVSFQRPGSDPEVVERELLMPIAARAARLEGIEETWGEVSGSSGSLQIRFLPGTDLKVRELELRRAVTQLARDQPPGTGVDVGAQDLTVVSRFVMMLQVTGMGDKNALFDFVDERIRPRLGSVSGVSQVLPTGAAGRELTVLVDPDRSAAVGIDPRQVAARLASAVQRVRYLGGIEDSNGRTAVMLDGRPRGPVALGETRIDTAGAVRLRHVAEVRFGTGLPDNLFRVNGQSAVGLMVFKEEGANLVRLGRDVRTRMTELEDEFESQGIGFVVSFDAAEAVEDQLDRLKRLASWGFFIALVVLFIFLRQWRAVAVVGVAVPVSLLAAMAMLYLGGLTLNVVTLFGLAVGIGMLVDNSIVVYEAVQRQLEHGATPDGAAEAGVRRTARAIFAASATNAVVFLPLTFTAIDDTSIRILVRILALAILIPLAASLVVAVGLVPLLARRLAAPAALARIAVLRKRRERFAGWRAPDRARELFSAVLKVALRRPGGWIAGTAVAVIFTVVVPLSWVAIRTAAQEAPEADTVLIAVSLPPGGSLDAASDAFGILETAALDLDGVESVESFIQDTGGSLNVHLVPAEERPEGLNAASVRAEMRKAAARDPEIDLQASTAGGGGGTGGGGDPRGRQSGLTGTGPTEVVLSGPDFERLYRLGREIENRLQSIDEMGSVQLSVRPGPEELRVYPDDLQLAAYGLTADQFLPVLRTLRREGVDLRVGFTLPDGRDIPLTVRRVPGSSRPGRDLENFRVSSSAGVLPLGAVSRIRRMPGEPAIQHHNGRREISVFYTFNNRAPQTGPARLDLEERIREAIRKAHRPIGYTVETPEPDEGFDWFRRIVVPAMLLLFALLAITFESLTLPVLVLVSLPLTLLGATWALAFSGTAMGPMALAGALALIGLTVNPAILLVDRMQQRVRSGATTAGAAALAAVRERTRPVLMTAATTLAGLWPLALTTGQENELWPPFATIVMGGLATSAVLTLLMIPLGFVILHRLDALFGRLGPWVVIGWAGATALIMTPMIQAGLLTTMTWKILTTVLVASLLLGLAAWLFRRPDPRVPDTADGPPVLEARYLTKTYGRPGPIGRAWRVQQRFVRRVADRGGRAFDPVDARARVLPLLFVLAGALYLALTVETRFWQLVFAFTASALAARALIEFRRGRGRVDDVGRVLSGGAEGVLAAACPWFALGAVAYDIVAPASGTMPSTRTWVVLGILGTAVAIVQAGRRTAVRISRGKLSRTVTAGRLRRVRTLWRRLSRRLFGLDLPREEVRALVDIHLRFDHGMIGVLGPNGAGKTTFLRMLSGILDPSMGTIRLGGVPLEVVRRHLARWVGYLPQEFGLPRDLSAREYLEYYALLYGLPRHRREERVRTLLEEVGLGDRADDRIGGYSGGMRQRVAVARTLLRLPPVIIVDEPTVGLDPRERIRFRNLLSRLAAGRVVLFSTHVVEDVAVACQRVVVLARGRLVFDGKPAALAQHAQGRVWEIVLIEGEDAELPEGARIVDQVPTATGNFRTRILSAERPHPAAEAVEPSLEDGYLVLAGT